MELTQIQQLAMNGEYWFKMKSVPTVLPQFSYTQLKHLFWSNKDESLNKCTRIVGKTRYINIKLFALWLSGEL